MAKRSKKPLTDEEKFELELQQEAELQHQQRDYTLLCKDRELTFGSGGLKLEKQERVIQLYREELDNLTNDLNVALSDGKKKIDRKEAHELIDLLNEHDQLSEAIKIKKTHLNEVDMQIVKISKDVAYARSIQLTDKMWQDRTLAGEKTLEALENKLEVQTKKFCTICAENSKLRDIIDHLLQERADFNIKWDKMIKNLCIGKKFMLDLIEQATMAYDQREEWCSKLKALRNKAHKDLVAHVQEMRELKRKEDDEIKLTEFFSTKGQKRIMATMEEKERAKRQEKRIKIQEKLGHYTEIVNDIYQFTEGTSLDNIVHAFTEREVENFSLFKYLLELNRDMEELNDTLGYLHLDIDEERALMTLRSETQQETLQKLRDALDEATQSADADEFELRNCEEKLNHLVQGIGELMNITKCSNDPLMPLLGENMKINDFNILLYLEILERHVQTRICDVYNREHILNAKKKLQPKNKFIITNMSVSPLLTIDDIVASNPCPLCIEHELASGVIDSLQRVQTREQVEAKLAARLELPDGMEKVHQVSACHIPKSRRLIQRIQQ